MQFDHQDVSRETSDRLETFAQLVRKWTAKINLISRNTVGEIWDRHIRDSMQLLDLAPDFDHWADLGSGGGFPGVVIAILAKEGSARPKFTLVESDLRKAAFLRTAVRELDLDATVLAERIENLSPLNANVLSARALADLTTLVSFADVHLAPTGTAIFPKGRNWREEHRKAQEAWSYSLSPVDSRTDEDAAILIIKDIKRV
ncbi:16S rRNA (guanine(527)-N(7))-methyltransferase RsmG [Sulfitobacter alexandrii]|uniref:Ribosomal RNA small subunit methyltransferase G n=1 Tax=Sulfitobacter alexandrii TaxID=1917485 RepID=A0A1J0WLA0_9RHOB|nr:16S rRNA (guanine(527)-N(7))-methyltransferase RsmG [Sulfitobacter alexandrii]APE45095.1 16S rRNA (guanine(527)-N(7))-methyltransferase RsmG [Sulfitobacter alexandrii]